MGLCRIIGFILGLYRTIGFSLGVIQDYRVIGFILVLCRVFIGIMEKKMGTTNRSPAHITRMSFIRWMDKLRVWVSVVTSGFSLRPIAEPQTFQRQESETLNTQTPGALD